MDLQLFETVVLVFHVLAAIAIIGLVLIQHGKGADMGTGFGGGASSTVFGSGGAGNFLSRMTTWIAVAFFLTSFALAYVAKEKSGIVRNLGIPQVETVVPAPTGEIPALEEQNTDVEIPVFEEEPAEQ